MKLRVMFVRYPGQDLMPNAMEVVDEYMEEEHNGTPDYFKDACQKVIDAAGEEIEVRYAFVWVPDADVLKLFESPVLGAVIRSADDG